MQSADRQYLVVSIILQSSLFTFIIMSIVTADRLLGPQGSIFPVALTVTGKYCSIFIFNEGMEEFHCSKTDFLTQVVAARKFSIQITFLVHAFPLFPANIHASSSTIFSATTVDMS